MKPILLGTQSSYKKSVFAKLGLAFDIASPPFEEIITPGVPPQEVAAELARGKANSLRENWSEHVIIGADQVLACEGEIFSKPGSVDAAVAQLLKLSGKTHELHTAFCVLDAETGETQEDIETARISFWPDLNADYLRNLVERDQTTDCVGAYKFESGGILLMERVEMEDPNAIIGLPLMRLARALSHWGYLADRFY